MAEPIASLATLLKWFLSLFLCAFRFFSCKNDGEPFFFFFYADLQIMQSKKCIWKIWTLSFVIYHLETTLVFHKWVKWDLPKREILQKYYIQSHFVSFLSYYYYYYYSTIFFIKGIIIKKSIFSWFQPVKISLYLVFSFYFHLFLFEWLFFEKFFSWEYIIVHYHVNWWFD